MPSLWPPKKNAAFTLLLAIRDADGDLVSGAASLDSEISKDGGAFADCTNEATEIGATGIYSLALTAAEMNADYVFVQTKTGSAGAKTAVNVLYTTESTWDEGIDAKAVLTGAITAPSFAAGAIDAAAIAADAIGASELATDAVAEIVDAVWDEDIEAAHGTAATAGKKLNDTETAVDTEVAAIKAVTDALPNAGALTTIQADLDDVQARLPAALVGGRIDANLGAISGDAAAADNLEAEYDGTGYKDYLRRGTAQAGAASTITLDASASATDDLYNGLVLALVSGLGVGQARLVTDYVGATKVATIAPNWITNPDATSVFALIPWARVDLALWLGSAPNALVGGRVDVSAGALAAGVITTASFTAGAIDAAAIATDAIDADAIAANAIGSSEIAAGAITAAKFAAGAIDATAIATDAIGSAEFAQAAADKVWLSATRTLTSLGASLVQEIWDRATSALTVAGSIGKLLVDNVNATISSRSSHSAADVWTSATRSLTASLDPSAATIADAVWDELSADHVGAGSVGERVERLDVIAAGGAGGLTNARAVLLDNLDAAVSSRATPAQVNAEVLDVLNTDTFAEPGQEAPPATTTLVKKIGYLYKLLRNKVTQDGTTLKVFADDTTTVDQKATVTDDGTTYTRGEIGTGP